jgi:single-stranded DNA-binding protein
MARTEWHRVFAWRNLSKFAKTLQKGQLVTLEGTGRGGVFPKLTPGQYRS